MVRSKQKIILAVGGFDPSGHAGILADARVFQNLGVPFVTALSALTAQSETKFFAWEPVPLKIFRAQLEAVPKNLAGMKIGMIGTPTHARALSEFIAARKPKFVLWDPALVSSTGASLLRMKRPNTLLWNLMRQIDLATPNLPEAEWFLGAHIGDPKKIAETARSLLKKIKPGGALILKGGHSAEREAVDYLATTSKLTPIRATRRKAERRGTGCTFGAACLAFIVLGKTPLAAARAAKRYVLKNVFDKVPT